MKGAYCVVSYHGGYIDNIAVDCYGGMVTFQNTIPHKHYELFGEMYEAVLEILKNNGYTISYYDEFGVRWYDIMWVNLVNSNISKFGYNPNFCKQQKGVKI